MMALFDSLPLVIRRAIVSADFPFHPGVAVRLMRRHSPERVAALIRSADCRLCRIGGA